LDVVVADRVLVASLGESLRPVDEQDVLAALGWLVGSEDEQAGGNRRRVEQVGW